MHRIHSSPLSPLFPYTTLFRSACSLRRESSICRTPAALPGVHTLVARNSRERRFSCAARSPITCSARPYIGEESTTEPDRKSTRLNSSHITISYAVFCLQKKKLCSYKTSASLILSPAPHPRPNFITHSISSRAPPRSLFPSLILFTRSTSERQS